ncbi:hypothetical protein DYB25_004401 [Aphanomyces astaci]|uniref:Uncharacterized protein n=2 Tax=Aphanomyces astaci TaxID=112090 RepID=A0A397B3H8_APHAT|nr:hypothetical protein DYB25_004401 [Aphanomyces astaci]
MVVMVPTLSQMLVQSYAAVPQSSYLYCANQIVKNFASSASSNDLIPVLDHLFTQLSYTTFTVLSQSLVDHPDIVEEYFYLVERYVRSLPGLTVPLLPSILQEWVQAALTGTGTAGLFAVLDATGRVAPEDKAAFVQNLVTAADEAAFRRAVRQFSKLCRQRAVVV